MDLGSSLINPATGNSFSKDALRARLLIWLSHPKVQRLAATQGLINFLELAHVFRALKENKFIEKQLWMIVDQLFKSAVVMRAITALEAGKLRDRRRAKAEMLQLAGWAKERASLGGTLLVG